MYIIHDIKNNTYYTRGTQTSYSGQVGPRWTYYKSEAIVFHSVSEAKAAMYRLKKIRFQDNRSIMYERY